MSDCEITYARVRSHGPSMSGQVGTEVHTASRRANDGLKRRAQHAGDDDIELLDHQHKRGKIKRQRSPDKVQLSSGRRAHHSSQSPAEITAISRPPSPPLAAAAVSVTVEKYWRKTWTFHPLGEAASGSAKVEEPIAAGLDEDGEDGRIKPMTRGNKPAWKAVDGAEERCWDGFRFNGTTYWAGDGIVARTKEGSCYGVIRLLVERRRSARGTSSFHCHLQWMKSLAVGRDDELFLEDRRCEDILLTHILRKLNFVMLSLTQTRQSVPNTSRFCRLVAESDHRLRDPLPAANCANGCDGCQSKATFQVRPRVPRRGQSLMVDGEELHINDNVMMDSGETGVPYVLGRVSRIDRPKRCIVAQVFERHVDRGLVGYKDERRLIITEKYEFFSIDRVRGRCVVVRSADEITKHETHPAFWCADRLTVNGVDLIAVDDLPVCAPCAERRQKTLKRNRAFAKAGRLPFADLYSGAGGGVLSVQPFFDVITALEMDPTACATLRRNHGVNKPKLRVLEGRFEDLHQRALKRAAGEPYRQLYELGDEHRPLSKRRIVPNLPEPGSIVGVTAGIPCQPHSRINMFKKPDDGRTNQLGWFMSEVERLRPAYVVLENVPGFKDGRNGGTFALGGVQSYAHAAMSMLVHQDYQCQLAVLDARAYGSPQNRSRLWIVAARRGLPLPKMPLPTHANPLSKSTRISLDVDGRNETVTYIEDGTVGTGPFPCVTVEDAIGDMPAFEFYHSAYFSRSSLRRFEPITTATGDKRVGFNAPCPYASAPQSSYQSSMRKGNRLLRDHFTPRRNDTQIAQCYDALQGTDLPGYLQALDAKKGFATLITSNAPGGKATRPIHYNARTKTIAEDKRAMGFPDDYRICGTAEQQIAQLGNAWVVPMGQAIVREIRNVIRDEWIAAGQPADMKQWWQERVESSCASLV